MDKNWHSYQPHYDTALRLVVEQKALKVLLEQEYKALTDTDLDDEVDDADTSKKRAQLNEILPILESKRSMLITIQDRIIKLGTSIFLNKRTFNIINEVFSSYDSIYKHYHKDVKANIEALKQLEKKYDALVKNNKLIKGNEQWRVNEWVIDTSKLYSQPPFFPQVTADIKAPRSTKEKNRLAEVLADMFYEQVRFKYAGAHEGNLINRYVIFWEYNKHQPDQIMSAIPHNLENRKKWGVMGPTGYGQTNETGILHRADINEYGSIHIKGDNEKTHYLESEAPEDGSLSQIIPQIKHHQIASPYLLVTAEQLLQKKLIREYDIYSVLHNSHINPTTEQGFFLYPLDWGPFATKPMKELAAMDFTPPLFHKGPIESAVKEDINSKNPNVEYEAQPKGPGFNKIYTLKLYCTLPEWNARLKLALNELAICLDAYNLGTTKHKRSIYLLERQLKMAELQIEHTYDEVSENDLKITKKFINAVYDMQDGITTLIEEPGKMSSNNKEAEWFSHLLTNIEKHAENLYDLISSPELLSELKRYIEHTKDQDISEDGEFPPGPYMNYEPHWNVIFQTIAECYAALANTTKFAKKIWDEDLQYGIDEIATVTQNSTASVEIMAQAFADENHDTTTDIPVDTLVKDQEDELVEQYSEAQNGSSTKETLSSIIFKDPVDKTKKFLDLIVPTPGPPSVLEVIINAYDVALSEHVTKKSKNHSSYKLILFSKTTVMFGINEHNNVGIALRKQIMAGLIVRSNQPKNIFPHVKRARESIHTFFSEMSKSKPENGKAYKGLYIFKNDATGAKLKALFVLFNTVLMLQAAEKSYYDEQMGKPRKTLEMIKASVSTIQTGLVGVMLWHRITKNPTNLKLIDKFAIGAVADGLGTFVGLIAGSLAFYDGVEAMKDGDTKKAIRLFAESGAALMTITGYMRQKGFFAAAGRIATKLVIREATVAAASAATASTVIGAPLGAALMLAGTALNVLLIVYDIVDETQKFFIYSITEHSIKPWSLLKYNQSHLLEDYHKSIKAEINGKTNSPELEKINQLKAHAITKMAIDFFLNDSRTPYDTYIDKNIQKGSEDLILKPAKVIEELYFDDKTKPNFFEDSVDWEDLTWRAVIPLFKMKHSAETISDMIELGDIEDDEDDNTCISSVSHIIEFYNSAVEQLQQFDEKDLPLDISLVNTVVDLEDGTFTPDTKTKYLFGRSWRHPDFQRKASENGLLPLAG